MITRVCNRCGVEKSLEYDFGKNSKYDDGKHRICKECINTAQRKTSIKPPQGYKFPKEGSSDMLDIKHAKNVLYGANKSYKNEELRKYCKPQAVFTILYDHVPTEREFLQDVKPMATVLDMKHRKHSWIDVTGIDIVDDSYQYEVSQWVKYQPYATKFEDLLK